MKMELIKIKDKHYISLENMLKLGFPRPTKGTPILYLNSIRINYLFDIEKEYENYRIYQFKENWEGVFISPFASYIGNKNVSESDVFVPFTIENFKFIEFDSSLLPSVCFLTD